MGRRDAFTFLSENQAITAQAVSTNSLFKGVAQAQINTSLKPLFIVSTVTTAFTDGGGNTGTNIDLIDDSTVALTATTAVLQPAILSFPENAAVGTTVACMAPTVQSKQAYWGVRYSPQGANLTAGAVTTWLTNQRELHIQMPPAYIVES